MNITYDTIRGSRIVTAKDQGALILRTGTIYDGIGRDASHDLDLLLDGGKIVQVAPRGSFDGKGLPVWDCSDKFVMPGLIEAHLHMSGMHTQEPYRRYFENNDVRLIRALGHAEELLAHGYTTVRELGAKGRGIGIREGIGKGLCRGPRILTSIEFLSPTGGHGDWPILPYDFVKETSMRSVLVDGPDQCVYAVRRLLREGADLVKIVTATGNMGQPYDNMKFRACFNLKEIRAMSDEAHEQGKKIAAHVVGDVGLRNALDGGIDTIEHCLFNFEKNPELLERQSGGRRPLLPQCGKARRICKGSLGGRRAHRLRYGRKRNARHRPLPGGIRLPRQGGPAELCDPAGREQRRRENAGPSGQDRLARGGQIRGHSRPEQEPAGGHLDPAQQGKHCLRRAGRVRKGSVL